MVEHSNELAECGIEKKERFISAMESIYAISRVSAIELFEKIFNEEAHDYHSVRSRICRDYGELKMKFNKVLNDVNVSFETKTLCK